MHQHGARQTRRIERRGGARGQRGEGQRRQRGCAHLMREAIKDVVHLMREAIKDVVHLMREAIIGRTQWQLRHTNSTTLRGHSEGTQRHSEALRGSQRHSEA